LIFGSSTLLLFQKVLVKFYDMGKELFYIAGNHDFWMNDYLKNEFGIRLYYNDLEITINDKRFYIYHGDGIAKRDKGYRIIKRIFRNKTNVLLYRWIHPDLGIPIAKWMSDLSRKHRQLNVEKVERDYIEKAHEKFKEGFDYTIFGHLHLPRYQRFGKKVYINLGDWIEHFTYAVFDGTNLKLLNW
jgi:UDP-2,3-diacylglucosamine hydrolase